MCRWWTPSFATFASSAVKSHGFVGIHRNVPRAIMAAFNRLLRRKFTDTDGLSKEDSS